MILLFLQKTKIQRNLASKILSKFVIDLPSKINEQSFLLNQNFKNQKLKNLNKNEN